MSRLAWLGVGLLLLAVPVYAQTGQETQLPGEVEAFRQLIEVSDLSVAVPTVVEVPLGTIILEQFDVAVVNIQTLGFEPVLFEPRAAFNKSVLTATASPVVDSIRNMVDGDAETYTAFELPAEGSGNVLLTVSSQRAVTASALTLLLEKNVALPSTIKISANTSTGTKIVVAEQKMTGQTVRFPETTSNQWLVELAYAQPLRITDIRLQQENTTRTDSPAVRWLAQPGVSYGVYYDADRSVKLIVGEAGNLSIDDEVLVLRGLVPQTNPRYVAADIDEDGVPDRLDNCVSVSNADQADVNGNGRGDACDDFDRDGRINSLDNCPNQPNSRQADVDSDGIGDVCDEEESRLTERYTWVPWVGIGFAIVVLIVLFTVTARHTMKSRDQESESAQATDEKSEESEDTPPVN